MKISRLWFLLLLPSLMHAVSFGVSVPIGITEHEKLSYGSNGDDTYSYKYKNAMGLGFVLDTNVAKESVFGYRLVLQYTLAKLDSTNNPNITSLKKHKYDMIHNFAFGIVQKPGFKWWVGPRINTQIEHGSGPEVEYQNSWGFGIGAATGVNFKVAQRIALAADLGYQGDILFGGQSDPDGSVYFGTSKGLTAQFYLLFVFGEESQAKAPPSVIDDGL